MHTGSHCFEFRSSERIKESSDSSGELQRLETTSTFLELKKMDEGMSGFCIKSIRCGGGNGGSKCGRWNPTTEQVKVLTDLFRSGLRTPSTDQIQKISAQLSFYGKIESKNVFYWFQNHKARERQKRRKVSVDIDKDPLIIRRDKDKIISSPKEVFAEVSNQVTSEPARVIETLQLFPINSFDESGAEKLKFYANEYSCKERTRGFTYNVGEEMDRHPPLDLRLSFI